MSIIFLVTQEVSRVLFDMNRKLIFFDRCVTRLT